MEEKKEKAAERKSGSNAVDALSYDELKKVASELHFNYQKMTEEYRKLKGAYDEALKALDNQDFNYMSFFLQMLFKVEEHAEMYSEEFVKWATKNIEQILVSFADSMENAGKSDDSKTEGAKK